MRKQTMILLVAVVVAAAPWLLSMATPAPDSSEPGTITVSGEAEIRIVPDEVIFTVGIETSDMELTAAKQKNDQVVKAVMARTKQFDIPADHIQTDYIHIEPRYHDNYTQRELIGYFVQNTIVITLRDLSRFEDLLTALLESGVNYVHNIEFRTTDLREHRDAARELALQAAQEKATAMAETLSQRLGEPRAIQEQANQWWSGYSSWWGASRWGGMTQNVIQEIGGESIGDDSSLAPGQIAITARVSVSFAMMP